MCTSHERIYEDKKEHAEIARDFLLLQHELMCTPIVIIKDIRMTLYVDIYIPLVYYLFVSNRKKKFSLRSIMLLKANQKMLCKPRIEGTLILSTKM